MYKLKCLECGKDFEDLYPLAEICKKCSEPKTFSEIIEKREARKNNK